MSRTKRYDAHCRARRKQIVRTATRLDGAGAYPSIRLLVDALGGSYSAMRRHVAWLKDHRRWEFEVRRTPHAISPWQQAMIRRLLAEGLSLQSTIVELERVTGRRVDIRTIVWHRDHEATRPSELRPSCEAELLDAIGSVADCADRLGHTGRRPGRRESTREHRVATVAAHSS